MYRLEKDNSKVLLFEEVKIADDFFSSLAGLMFKKALTEESGLLITSCNSIHTFWMRFPIDVIFIDRDNRAVRLLEDFKPFRLSPVVFSARKVLEVKSGSIFKKKIRVGDLLFSPTIYFSPTI